MHGFHKAPDPGRTCAAKPPNPAIIEAGLSIDTRLRTSESAGTSWGRVRESARRADEEGPRPALVRTVLVIGAIGPWVMAVSG